MDKHFRVKTSPIANEENVIKGNNYRITILTNRLIRIEYSNTNNFIDSPTQMVWFRDFSKVEYTYEKVDDKIHINTGMVDLVYDEKPLSKEGLIVKVLSTNYEWKYGEEPSNLLGTTRTLDEINGDNVKLSKGIMSRDGISVIFDNVGAVGIEKTLKKPY